MNKFIANIFCIFAFLFADSSLATTVQTPFDAMSNSNFSVQLSRGGGFLIKVGSNSYSVESNFSYPHMKPSHWNAMTVVGEANISEGWRWQAKRNGAETEITATGTYYQLHRKIELLADRIVISDTFSNTSRDDIAIVFKNMVVPQQAPQKIYIAGTSGASRLPNNSDGPSANPSIFYKGTSSGLGIVALDDFYRLQLSIMREGDKGIFYDKNFGLPPGRSYTFKWAVYPGHSSDYYSFINAVRHDYVTPVRIDGGLAFMPYNFATSKPRALVAKWLAERSAKIVILVGPYSGAPWLGGYGHYNANMPPVPFSESDYLNDLKAAVSAIKSIDPKVKCLAPFETAQTPDQPAGLEKPAFPDDVAIDADGRPMGYDFPSNAVAREAYIRFKGHSFIYYPTLSNSYYKSVRSTIEQALKITGIDGIYFDLSNYATPGFRWTYSHWDQHTVDVDLTNYTIKRKKTDLAKLTEDARASLMKMVLDFKDGNVVVANGMPFVSRIRALPVMHFIETVTGYGYAQTQLATPIVLGWTNGYKLGALAAGKQGAWWKSWSSDADYFSDIREKIASGNLYFTYWAPPGQMYNSSLTHSTILAHMYPITITKIGSGTIMGHERIITLHSGTYSWGDKTAAKAYFYDDHGKEISGKLTSISAGNGIVSFKIEVPKGGAAVIEKL